MLINRQKFIEEELTALAIQQVKNVSIGRVIGEGKFGQVFQVLEITFKCNPQGTAFGGSMQVALKKLTSGSMDSFIQEASLLMKIKHVELFY